MSSPKPVSKPNVRQHDAQRIGQRRLDTLVVSHSLIGMVSACVVALQQTAAVAATAAMWSSNGGGGREHTTEAVVSQWNETRYGRLR